MKDLKLLVVDDDLQFLTALKSRLARLHPSWDVRYAVSGTAALELTSSFQPEAVIAELRLPDMDGADFLGRIKAAFPMCFRVALSGKADSDQVLRLAEHAHRIQTKPCLAQTMMWIVDEGVRLLRQLEGSGLKAWIGSIDRLPDPPQGLQTLLRELQQPGSNLDHVEKLLHQDVSLAAHLLHVANSSYFGGGAVDSVKQAIQRLGFDIVQGVVMSLLIRRSLTLPDFCGALVEMIHHDCQRVIPFALQHNKETFHSKFRGDVLVTAVLLQDIGKLVLMTYDPYRYVKMVRYELKQGSDFLALERSHFGYTHPQVGACLLRLWGLPESIVTAVALHHEVYEPPYAQSLSCLLYLAGQDMLQKDASPNSFFMSSLEEERFNQMIDSLEDDDET